MIILLLLIIVDFLFWRNSPQKIAERKEEKWRQERLPMLRRATQAGYWKGKTGYVNQEDAIAERLEHAAHMRKPFHHTNNYPDDSPVYIENKDRV